jgi:hypothetical protein
MLILLDYCNKNLPIYLDEETECIVYKEHSINYKSIKEAYESGYDRISMTPNLVYRRKDGYCTWACLELTELKTQQLIKKTWKLLKK